MQLEYFWIGSYRNIKKQEFNLGGKRRFFISKNIGSTFTIAKEVNPSYVRNFFSLNSTGFSNITAIVGENGSGKSNSLDFIRGVISNGFTVNEFTGETIETEFIAIFSDSTDKIYILSNLGSSKFRFNFKYTKIVSVRDGMETIFYSPSYDFRIFPISNRPGDIDVSSNSLLEDDYYDTRFALKNVNQAEVHNYANSSRQIEFFLAMRLQTVINEKITIPEFVDIILQWNDFGTNSQDFHNTPYRFREFYELMDDKHRDEINILAGLEHDAKTKVDEIDLFEIKGKMFVSWAIYLLLRNLYANIERTNHFLMQGHVELNLNDLSDKNFEDVFNIFISAQNIFPKKEIISLIQNIHEVSMNLEEFNDGPQDLKVGRIRIELMSNLQKAYLEYERSMRDIAGGHMSYGFIDFDWHGLSSGEKAYLDLYSRIYYARKLIYERIYSKRSYPKIDKFPKNIILLMDEAELGFHLQWQKEYVKNLIDILPLIFLEEKPNIQIVFATHSPISLSDIPHSNVIYLKRVNGTAEVLNSVARPKHSFGANIYDLLHDGFYFNSGYMGDFAEGKIQEAIDWCLNSESKTGSAEIEKLISLIDEPLIKVKLSEMFSAKMGHSIERARLEKQREYIENRLKELGSNDTN